MGQSTDAILGYIWSAALARPGDLRASMLCDSVTCDLKRRASASVGDGFGFQGLF